MKRHPSHHRFLGQDGLASIYIVRNAGAKLWPVAVALLAAAILAGCSEEPSKIPETKNTESLTPTSLDSKPPQSSSPTPETPAADQRVGEVNGVEFTLGDLVQRIRVLKALKRPPVGTVASTDPHITPFEHLHYLINAEILRQQAPSLGITPPVEEEITAAQLQSPIANTEIPDSEHTAIIEDQLFLKGLTSWLGNQIVSPQEQVEIQWIILPLEGDIDAEDVFSQIQTEDFGTAAAEFSIPDGYADSSGYVGWVPEGAFPDLDQVLWGDETLGTHPLASGEISGPIFTFDGIYIINMLLGPSVQGLNDQMREKLKAELVQAWQSEQLERGHEDGTVKVSFDSTVYQWVADQVD